MDYAQVEEKFKTLKEQFTAGKLDEAAFKAKLNELMVQDGQGRWWMIGYETGQWYTHDGAAWVRSDPPGRTAPAPAQPHQTSAAAAPAKPVEATRQSSARPAAPPVSPAQKSTAETLPPAKAVKKMGWGFWLGWIGSIAAGFGVVVGLMRVWPYDSSIWAFAIGAGTAGFFQWLVMRQYLQGSAWWIPANAIFMGITAWIGNSGSSDFAYFLLFVYGIINVIVMPVVISRKRRSI